LKNIENIEILSGQSQALGITRILRSNWVPRKEKLTIDMGFSGVFVHLTDRLSTFGIIPDSLKVVDFIEEMEHLF
jgi:hypothetical protein